MFNMNFKKEGEQALILCSSTTSSKAWVESAISIITYEHNGITVHTNIEQANIFVFNPRWYWLNTK